MGFDGAADDAEAEAGALDLRAVVLVAAVEAFENKRQIVRGNTDAVVTDAEQAVVGEPFAADFDHEARARVLFEGVFNEVGEDLIPVKTIAAHLATIGGQVELDAGAPLLKKRRQLIKRVLDT